jgi:hypothetical protein
LAEFLIIIIIIYVFYLIGLDQIGLVLNLLDLNFNLIIAFHQEKKKNEEEKFYVIKNAKAIYLFVIH